MCCLRYCKSTIFQANHNRTKQQGGAMAVVCDTAKVRFFKQITTEPSSKGVQWLLFAILQKYDFSSKSQRQDNGKPNAFSCLRYCKSTIFQANHNRKGESSSAYRLFAILQKYDFSSKSQLCLRHFIEECGCLRYCKSTIFQANHNPYGSSEPSTAVVCDTAKVRFFKQITTKRTFFYAIVRLFAILQKYDFSSKSQPATASSPQGSSCLRYCKSTIFQANHNGSTTTPRTIRVVCDTAKVRFFKQITTGNAKWYTHTKLFAILQKYDFSSKSQLKNASLLFLVGCLRYCKSTIFQANHNKFFYFMNRNTVVCDTAKVRFFKQITTQKRILAFLGRLFAILQKYDFSSKSQQILLLHE